MLTYKFDWSIITSGQYFEWLVSGLKVTLQLSLAGIILSFLLGLIIAVMRMSHCKPFRWSACVYLEFFRNTPLLVQIFFWYFGSYKLLPTVVNDWLNNTGFEFAAGLIALTIYTSAFIAEDIRSGVLSIPKEQMEAARSAGFSYLRSMQYIILPQAVRITDSAAGQPVSQSGQELLAGHDHRRHGADLPGPPGGKLHLQGFRGLHRRNRGLPGPLGHHHLPGGPV